MGETPPNFQLFFWPKKADFRSYSSHWTETDHDISVTIFDIFIFKKYGTNSKFYRTVPPLVIPTRIRAILLILVSVKRNQFLGILFVILKNAWIVWTQKKPKYLIQTLKRTVLSRLGMVKAVNRLHGQVWNILNIGTISWTTCSRNREVVTTAFKSDPDLFQSAW